MRDSDYKPTVHILAQQASLMQIMDLNNSSMPLIVW